jgi:serine/threonine protein kinase
VTSDRAPFEVERELGTGATGRVHLARLTQPLGGLAAGTAVALKRLREELLDDPQAREAFELETHVGSALSHPGVTRVLSAGTDRHGPWMAQPFVPGETLAEHLAAGEPVPEPRVRALAAQLAGGLAALHAAGWAHGDVKPENMRLDERGRAVLLDLGFAAPLTKAAARRGARQSGSLAWLSPERARWAWCSTRRRRAAIPSTTRAGARAKAPRAPVAARAACCCAARCARAPTGCSRP